MNTMTRSNKQTNTHDAHHSSVIGYTSTALVAHQLLSSVMCSIGDNDWSIHSFILFLRDLCCLLLRQLPSTVPCGMSASYWQTWLNHDNMQCLMVDNKKLLTIGEDTDLLLNIFICFVFFAWYAKHKSWAFVFKCFDSSLQLSQPYSNIDKMGDL